MNWLIYGANGYTGKLVVELATQRGHTPLLGGRSEKALQSLGQKYNLPTRVFDLKDAKATVANLQDVSVVLNCAGPFSSTFDSMLNACLKTKTNYLDVTGEIEVFEKLFKADEHLKEAGISAISGVGFDVVPTDCLANSVKERLPDANCLYIAIKGIGAHISRGTAKTMFEGTARGGCIRANGKLVKVPLGYKIRSFSFNAHEKQAVTMPWGDVATAFYSTGIPNIEVYFAASKKTITALKTMELARPLLALPLVQAMGKKLIGRSLVGPTDDQRSNGRCIIVAEVENTKGQKAAMRMHCPEGYALTSHSALASVEKMLAGSVTPGALTPAMAFGAEFALELPGVTVEVLQ